MKIIIETKNWEQDKKVRKGKMQKELRDTFLGFGYNRKDIEVNMDVHGPAKCEIELAYERGYQKGLAAGGNPKWITFSMEYDEEEQEAILQGKLPEEEEEILATNGENVWLDTFMRDGSECYLDSGFDLVDGVLAWMPLPDPYKPESIQEVGRMRKCKVNGKDAYFHRWEAYAYVIAPSPMIGGHQGGQVRNPIAIVEFLDGVVAEASPKEIVFTNQRN